LSWVQATAVARPDDAFAAASVAASGPAGPDTAGHPGHFPGQAIVDDVLTVDDRSVAVGYVGIRGVWTAIAWRSTDGDRWDLAPIDFTAGSFAVSLAAGPGADRRFVAAGRSGPAPAVWDSADGRSWTRREVPTVGGGSTWERIVTVTASERGFIAGGSAGPELGDRVARLWHSRDGIAWEAVPDDPVFGGGEVVAIAERAGGFVALGRLGTGQRATGSVAWASDDGFHWRRVDSPDLTSGLVAAVAVAPDGSLVAVGSDLDERAAMSWRSTDGTGWEAAPSAPSLIYNDGDKIRMTDVARLPGGGFVSVGNFVGLQFGTATSWTSADGLTWRRAPAYPALEQGEMVAVATSGPELLAVGSFGAPDNYIPTIWRGPLQGG
jgi:hypothetical protein